MADEYTWNGRNLMQPSADPAADMSRKVLVNAGQNPRFFAGMAGCGGAC
jgi:hypothetical protein